MQYLLRYRSLAGCAHHWATPDPKLFYTQSQIELHQISIELHPIPIELLPIPIEQHPIQFLKGLLSANFDSEKSLAYC